MRFFIALELPAESIAQIIVLQQKLKQIIPQIRLTEPDKLHLTLAFIGEKPDHIKDQLISKLKTASIAIPQFEVTPAYIDGFPNLHHARIFWLGVKGEIDKLMLIRERVKDALVDLKLDVDERRYTPHITLAKIEDFTLTKNQEMLLESIIAQKLDTIKIASLKLFESIPDHGLHKHNTLAEIPLE